MFSSAIITSLVLGLSQIHGGVAKPVNASSVTITLAASDHFPHAKADLSPFDIDAKYIGYNATTLSWLASLNPASGTSDEEKARIMTEAAYAKPFDANDPDMAADVNSLLDNISGKSTALGKRDLGVQVSSSNEVPWSLCSQYLSCASGVSCGFYLDTTREPRSQCSSQGGSNCCISWSRYDISPGFFPTTWNDCNDEVLSRSLGSASCKNFGQTSQNGDICLSNRATHCS